MNKSQIEQFAVELTDKTETHDGWLAIVRFGMGTFQENQPLFIEIIVREAVRQLRRKNVASLTISDEVRFIFEELGLRLEARTGGSE